MSDAETDPLLPISVGPVDESLSFSGTRPSPKHILKIALRVKELIDIIIPICFDKAAVTRPDSPIINERVIELVKEAAGGKGDGARGSSSRKYRATLIFVLLTVKRWYHVSAEQLLFDATLFNLRAAAAEAIAQRIIEREDDERYLFRDVLCAKYSITLHSQDSEPVNALELAVDLHSTAVIGTSGYQRCIKWLWRGWLIQDSFDPNEYVVYKDLGVAKFGAHFTPARLKTPKYQNYIQLAICFFYLLLFTLTVNILQQGGDIDFKECLFFLFTLGSIIDESMKFYHVGLNYIGFWSVFNDVLYILVAISFFFRFNALTHSPDSTQRETSLLVAYRLLSCCAPFVWLRILLFLESLEFFGVMLVCLSQMIRESLIFFVLLIVLCCGFLQAFVGLDESDGSVSIFGETLHVILVTIMMEPDFDSLESLAWPYGKVLYYFFTFIVTILLLNILIALFGSAYGRVYDNAIDEYLALQAEKTLRFIRAPDSYVYVPPLNLIEMVLIPFKPFTSKKTYRKVNYFVMYIFYWPVLLVTAHLEAKTASRVKYNRLKGLDDDANEIDEEWDLLDGYKVGLAGGDSEGEEDSESETVVRKRISSTKKARRLANNFSGDTSAELEQMENTIACGDPEFHIDEDKWQRSVLKSAPKIELGDKSGSGWENYWLVKEINEIKRHMMDIQGSLTDTRINPREERQGEVLAHILDEETEGVEEVDEEGIYISKVELSSIVQNAVSEAVAKALSEHIKPSSSTQTAESTAPESSSSDASGASTNDSEPAETKKTIKKTAKKNKGRIARKKR